MPRKTAERILDAAESEFARKGYDATSLSDIAEAVGIRTPSLYSHFGSKQQIYEAVLDRLLEPYFRLMGVDDPRPFDLERSEEQIRTLLHHHASHPNLARLVQHAALAQSDGLAYIQKRIGEVVQGGMALVAERPPDDGGDTSMGLILAMMGVMMFGHVTLAPLTGPALGVDPLSKDVTDEVATLLTQLLQLARERATADA